MMKQSLDGQWKMRNIEEGGWISAQVPGSVLADLLRAELIEDPFYRDNEDQAVAVASAEYEYVREFVALKGLSDCAMVFLVLEGLDTLTDIYLNGQWLAANDTLLDEWQKRIGLRRLRVRRELDRWGESFEFEVNGFSIFAMGANYIPEDNVLGRRSRERTERLLRDAIAANFNCVRVWGGGFYQDDYFYDLCDELGLLVWQDFMFACGVYALSDDFAATVRQEVRDNIRRLRHHACLALWCGNNEMEVGWADWNFPKWPRHRTDYIKLFEVLIPTICKEVDPNTFYWPSSPSSGGSFDEPNAESRGDVHYWDVWHGLKPFTAYRKFFFRFCSEFGFQSFPAEKTVETFTLPQDRNIFSRVMEKHQKNGAANGKILYYLAQMFQYPKDFESLLYVSQLLQAEAVRYGVEHWRRNRGRCMGSIYWQLNDCWPVASWSSIDSLGRWKALHYFSKRFYAPILVSALDEGTSVSLFVTNETMSPVDGDLRWLLRDVSGRVIRAGGNSIAVEAFGAQSCLEVDVSSDLADPTLLRTCYLEFSLQSDRGVVSSGTLLFVPPKHFEWSAPNLSTRVQDDGETIALYLMAESFAKYVKLDLKTADGVFDDNYFDLSAGEEKCVRINKRDLSSPLTAVELLDCLMVRSLYDTIA